MLIRNVVIGLNPVDWKVLGGRLVSWQPGHVPGVDGAGVVVAVGENVSASWIGQRVAYHQSLSRHGSFAEYTSVKARAVLRVPASVSWEQAASLPCPALTAWLALKATTVMSDAAGEWGWWICCKSSDSDSCAARVQGQLAEPPAACATADRSGGVRLHGGPSR